MSWWNRLILACLIAEPLSASEKITPLSFRQIFFKILQSEGTLKNVPPASLILILKPISTFTEQGQNEVTLKNASGWGKRIQLGILNLNQISGRTGETLLSGGERVLSGGETLLSGWERVLSGWETLSSGGETPLSVWKRVLSGWETLLSGRERVLSGWERVLSGRETLLSGRERVLSGWETLLSGRERFLSGGATLLSGGERVLSGEETLLSGEENLRGSENTLERSNALCRQGNKGKIIIYIKYKRRKT
jgi:hypothetical protein